MVSRPSRALTHDQSLNIGCNLFGRNGVPPVEGIDTLKFQEFTSVEWCRNGVPPVEGIDTRHTRSEI